MTQLVGRPEERGALAELLDGARRGRSGALVLQGEPGVGKTALLRAAEAQAEGMLVLRGVGIESEAELAFAALHQIVRPVVHRIGRLPAPQAAALAGAFGLGPPTGADRFLISIALLGLLSTVAEEQPVVCLVDDAAWLDRASATALLFAARRLESEPIAMVFALRDVDHHGLDAHGLRELHVPALDRDACAALLADVVGPSLDPEVEKSLVDAAGGNPLVLVETARGLTAGQIAGAAPLPTPFPLGPELERALLGRVRRLPEEAQRLLLVAAADESRDLAVVARAAGALRIPLSALEDAERGGFLAVTDGVLHFRHPLVSAAVYRTATHGSRQAVHEALAAAHDARDPDRRAWHLAAAAVGVDDDVAADLERSAARASSRSGHAAASAALERAAQLTSSDELRAGRLVGAAEAAWLAGDPDRTQSLLRAAERLAPQENAARIATLRGWLEIRCGTPADAYATLRAAARAGTPARPEEALGLLRAASEAIVYTGEPEKAIELGVLAAELASAAGVDDRPEVIFLVGHSRLMSGDPAAAVPLLRRAIAASAGADQTETLIVGGLAAMALGDDETARELHYRAVQRARTTGAVAALPLALSRLAYSEWRLSRFGSALVNASEASRLAVETEQEAGTSSMLLALVAAVQGRANDCRAHADAALALATERSVGVLHAMTAWALGLLELGLGRPAEALALLEPIAGGGPASTQPISGLLMAPDTIEAAVRSGDHAVAQVLLARFELWAEQASERWALALLSRCRGLLSDGETAEAHFVDALELHAQSGRPFEQARTELAFGELLRRNRRRRDAREHLRVATALFARVGAAAWEERAQSELRATGERTRRRDPSTLAVLTPQELQIARLVAAGARNRDVATQLFLSPRTVDYHFRKVFVKLGIASRAELANLDLAVDAAY